MKAIFVTNFCSHYRVGAFEELSRHLPVRFYFFSDASERYWEKNNPVKMGDFDGKYLSGFYLFPRFRVSLTLVFRLLFDEYDIVIKCINGRFALPVTYVIARLRRKKFILWQTIWYHPRTFIHRISFPLLKHIWRHSDAIVVYGEHGKHYLVSNGIQSDKVFIAWQAVDNKKFGMPISEKQIRDIRVQLGILDRKVVLYVGRLVNDKGIEYLIDAFTRVQYEKKFLLLIGEGEKKYKLESMTACNDNVLFLGYVDQESLPVYYALASITVLPSVTTKTFKEPWGLVVNEAMNQGCPAIVTDAVGAGVGGLIKNGENGIVVPERDSKALAIAIEHILNDNQFETTLRTNAKKTISTWDFSKWAAGFTDAINYCLHDAK